MRDLNYELAPKPGMPASQRKAELDAARFVAVRNLAYMIYKKPDGSALMTYQETLDNRELVKTAILNQEISEGLIQNDLGSIPVPTSQAPNPMQNGAQQMSQPMAPQMSFQQPQMQAAPQAPMSPAQFAQVPMAQQPMAPQQMQPQYAAPPQQMMMPQMQPMQAPQMQPMQQQMPMAPPAAPMEAAPVTGKKRKQAAGNSVAPPPAGPALAPPGFQPAGPPQQAAVPVTQFAPQQQAPQPQFAPQPSFQPQQPMQPQPQYQQPVPQAQPQQQQAPQVDFGALFTKIDTLGKGVEIAANNGNEALKAVAKLQADLNESKLLGLQMLTCLHHMYLSLQKPDGSLLLAHMTEGKAGTLDGFKTYLQKYVGNPS